MSSRMLIGGLSALAVAATAFPVAAAADTAPTISDQPINAVVSTGATVRFTAAASGSPTPSVKWRRITCSLGCGAPTDIAGATTNELVVSSPPATTRYFAVFTNAAGSATTNTVGVTYRSSPIVTPTSSTPSTIDFAVGDTKLISATVTAGAPAPTVQWQESSDEGTTWTDVVGAVTTEYTIGPFTAALNGRKYRMVATNASGSATSGVTTLALSTAPVIAVQPQDATAAFNTTASFTVDATGSPTPTTTWERSSDGGATWTAGPTFTTLPNTYAFTPFSGTNTHLVRAIVSNAGGSVTSEIATLSAGAAPVIANNTTTPSNDVAIGASVTFSFLLLTGSPTPTYQWARKLAGESTFTAIPGATAATLTTPVSALDIGAIFQVVATNRFGSKSSNFGPVAIRAMPVISVQPVDLSTAVGSLVTFTSTGTSNPQWQASTDGGATWENVSGGIASSLTVLATSMAKDGTLYRVVYSNISGSVISAVARLSVAAGPIVLSDPVDQTVGIGQSATFVATAPAPIATATWQRSTDGGTNWATVGGGTLTTSDGVSTATLPVTSATSASNGYRYRVVFNRSPGVVTTQSASLSVIGSPVIVNQVSSRSVLAAASTTFTASATSTGVPDVKWERSADAGSTWTTVPGGTATKSVGTTNASLVIGPVNVADSGSLFRATFTNEFGSTVTSVGTLSVLTVTEQPTDATAAAGGTATFTAASNLAGATVRWEVMSPTASFYSTVSGATTSTLSVSSTASLSGNLYRAVFTSGTAVMATSPARLVVLATLPVVSAATGGAVATVGTVLQISAVGTASPTPSGSWESSTDGGTTWSPIDGGVTSTTTATQVTLTLAFPVTAVASTRVRAVFVNDSGTTRSTATTVAAAYTVTNPTDAAAPVGIETSFTAVGSQPGTSAWEVSTDGGVTFAPVTGGVHAPNKLTIVPTAAMDGNRYRARFTPSGSPSPVYYSAAATLTVATTTPPTIVSFSDDNLTNRTFTAVAVSADQPAATWQRSTDAGATWQTISPTTSTWAAPRLTTTLNVTMSLATSGSYRAVFTNANGSTPSTTVSFQTDFGPTIILQPTDVTVEAGGTATFTVGVAASPAPHSQYWEASSNGGLTWTNLMSPFVSPLVNECGVGYCTFNALMSSPHLLIRYRAVSLIGSATTSPARLDVTGPPVSSLGELAWPVSTGSPVKLIRQAYSGSAITSVAWERSGDRGATWEPVAGGTVQQLQKASEFRAELPVTPTAADNDARFRAVFTNQYGSTTTSAVIVDTNAPIVSSQPANVTRATGGSVSFSVAGFFYTAVAWQRSNDGGVSWATISGATTSSYSFIAVPAESGAKFRARLTSATGTTNSSAATLLIQSAPVMTTNPMDVDVTSGTTFELTAAATGLPTPTIQWQRSADQGASWTSEPGATSGTLSLVASAELDGIVFRARFINVAGTTDSSSATINVSLAPQTLHFDPAPPLTETVGAVFPVGVSASSGLVPAIAVTGPCTYLVGFVTVTGVGSCVVSAEQPGNATYAPAPPLSAAVSIAKAAQTLTVTPLPTVPATGSTATLVATSSSGLPVTLGASGGCSIAGSTVRFVTAGVVCTVTATQGGNSAYDAAEPVVRTTTAKSVQTISGFASLPAAPAVGSSFDVAAAATSGLTVAFTASGSCSIVGRTVTVISAGACSVTAAQSGDNAWFSAVSIVRTAVAPGEQTVTFAALPVSPAVGTSINTRTLASSSSGLAIVVAVSGGGCTASSATVYFKAAGVPCVVTVSQPGNTAFRPATPVSQSTTPSKAAQRITFATPPTGLQAGATFAVMATASSKLPVSLVASGSCTVDGTIVTVDTGTCTVRASQAGDDNYLAATDVVRTTIVKADQALTFLPLPIAPPVGSKVVVATLATSDSGLGLTFTASGSCSAAASTVTFKIAGEPCVVTATQKGSSLYNPAIAVSRSTTPVPGTQSLTFSSLPTTPSVGSTVALVARATSNLPVSFEASGSCAVAGATLTYVDSGLCSVVAKQGGDDNYLSATDVVRTSIVKADQTLTLTELPAAPAAGSTVVISVTSSAGLPVKLTAVGCAIASSKVKFLAAGTVCTVTATQAGNSYVRPATAVVATATPV